jgi:hypothetical protein
VIIVGRLIVAGLLGFGILACLAGAGVVAVPNHFNPFAPLRVTDEVDWLTRFKLSRLERDAPQCLRVLAQTPVVHRSVSDRGMGEGCEFDNVVEVSRSSIAFNRGFTATCSLTVAWAMFEVHVLRPAAQRHLGQKVTQVVHLGTYACRNINHGTGGRRSEHATANAIDLSSFLLADGTRVTVQNDWKGANPQRSAFLEAIRDGACGIFDVVLSPDYNEAHRNHFHLDMGSSRACR